MISDLSMFQLIFSHVFVCICTVSFVNISSYFFFVEKPLQQPPSGNPCVPSPCGPNSQCRVVGGTPACSCLPNYVGRAPNCRPECTINAECPSNLACLNEKCSNPCPGSCGAQASCMVVKHSPVCSCNPGYTGDPFLGCIILPSKITITRFHMLSYVLKLTSFLTAKSFFSSTTSRCSPRTV